MAFPAFWIWGPEPVVFWHCLAGHCQHGLGLDSNPPMLSVARARLDEPQFQHLHVQQGDILDLATHEACYDLVSLHQVLHYLDDPLAAICGDRACDGRKWPSTDRGFCSA